MSVSNSAEESAFTCCEGVFVSVNAAFERVEVDATCLSARLEKKDETGDMNGMDTVENKIEDKYDDFLSLLDALCCYYDRDQKEILALSISTAIRVLVHDTRHSTSLLSHAGKKERKFLSTNFTNTKESVHLGIVRRINAGVTEGKGGEAKYWPLCDERYFPMPQKTEWMKFQDWWNEPVFKSNQFTLTRKNLVLSISNKDGGAHFDAEVEKKYDEFRHSLSGGSSLRGINSGSYRGYDNIPIYPAIRQIGYELLCTLKS